MNHFNKGGVEYKEIYDFPDYFIGNNGTVLSKKKRNCFDDRILKPRIVKGYYYISIRGNKKKKTFKIHRLVALYFVEGYEDGLVVNHKDCNKLNNHFSNLEWVTIKDNNQHAIDNNRMNPQKGENRYNAILKNKDIVEIRRLYATGEFSQNK